MMKNICLLSIAGLLSLSVGAQTVKIKGVAHNNTYRWNGEKENMRSTYVGWNAELQKSIFVVEQGIYAMEWDGLSLTQPYKDPAVNISDFYSGGKYTDNQKALWANNFNLMVGNSGALYVDNQIVTVMSRDYQSTTDEELFAVRKWDATTGDLLNGAEDYMHVDSNLESAGMCYNPIDGKIYGLFYLTNAELSEEITSDPEYFTDEDEQYEGREGQDAGYCICTVEFDVQVPSRDNPGKMVNAPIKITPVTPGLYYYNFVTFAINSEGRAFALTSGGTAGYEDADGRMRNINGELAGAQLCEFDLETGLMVVNPVQKTDSETGEVYTEYVSPYSATGYCSQYRRQAACFAKSNPDKMYWNGYVNSGKGINDNGSWSTLPDRYWEQNGKFDTALYEIDINTGVATRLAKFDKRWTFSTMWVDGDDASDGCGIKVYTVGIDNPRQAADVNTVYNLRGQNLGSELPQQHGIYIVNGKKIVR